MRTARWFLWVAPLLAACGSDPVDPPIIDAEAAVGGVVYLDIDGTETVTGFDQPVEGVPVLVRTPGTSGVLSSDTSDASGEFLMEDVPVGSVEVVLADEILGDSLLLVPRDSIRYTVTAQSALVLALGVTYPQLTLAQVRESETGRTILTQGVVLNPRGQAPGGAVHVEGDGVALRVLAPPAVQVAVGDSVRILGRTARDLGQPALADGEFYRVAPRARDVIPGSVSIADARVAADGRDAALVEITEGSVASETPVPEGFLLRVAEAGDTLDVRLRTEQGFFQGGIPEGAVVIRLVGLLVPNQGEGTWSLVPRTPLDVRLGPPPAP